MANVLTSLRSRAAEKPLKSDSLKVNTLKLWFLSLLTVPIFFVQLCLWLMPTELHNPSWNRKKTSAWFMRGFCKMNNMAVWLKVLMMWLWSGTAVFRYGRLEGGKGSRSASRLIISARYFSKSPAHWSNSRRAYVLIRLSTFERDLSEEQGCERFLLTLLSREREKEEAQLLSALLFFFFFNWIGKHLPYFTGRIMKFFLLEKQQGHV